MTRLRTLRHWNSRRNGSPRAKQGAPYPKNFRKLMRTLVDAVRYKSGLIITNPGVPPR